MADDNLLADLLASLNELGVQDGLAALSADLEAADSAEGTAANAALGDGGGGGTSSTAALVDVYVRELPSVAVWLRTVPPRAEIDFNDPAMAPHLEKLHQNITIIRKITADEKGPVLEPVVDAGLVPLLVGFLTFAEMPMLQYEAAWALTNVASGKSEFTDCVVNNGAVPVFISLLSSSSAKVADQVVWALGNIAGDGSGHRDCALANGALEQFEHVLQTWLTGAPSKLECVAAQRNFIWALGNLVRGKPPPDEAAASRAVPMIRQFMSCPDVDARCDALWALSYILDAQLCLNDILPLAVEALAHTAPDSHPSALVVTRIAGSLCEQEPQHFCDELLAGGLLPWLAARIAALRVKKSWKSMATAFWVVSNVAAGTLGQIRHLCDTDLLETAAAAATDEAVPLSVATEALYCITNVVDFLGSTGSYRDFMPGFAGLVVPLLQVVVAGRVALLNSSPRVALGNALDAILAGINDEEFSSAVVEQVCGSFGELIAANFSGSLDAFLQQVCDSNITMPHVESKLGRQTLQEDGIPVQPAKRSGGSQQKRLDDTDRGGGGRKESTFRGFTTAAELDKLSPTALLETMEGSLAPCVARLRELVVSCDPTRADEGEEVLLCTTYLRKLSAADTMSSTLGALVSSGAVEPLLCCLDLRSLACAPAVVYEAAWTLTNICSGTSEHVAAVCGTHHDVVGIFVELLTLPFQLEAVSRQWEVRIAEQAAWTLGNVAGDSLEWRDAIVASGGIEGLLDVLEPGKLQSPQNAMWALSNLCSKPHNGKVISCSPAIVAAAHRAMQSGTNCLQDALWVLSHLLDEAPENIDVFLQERFLAHGVVQLLLSNSNGWIIPALGVVGTVLAGTEAQAQALHNAGAVSALRLLLENPSTVVVRKSLWALCNACAGAVHQIQCVLDAGILPHLILFASPEVHPSIAKEALVCLQTIASVGTAAQCACLVEAGAVAAAVAVIASTSARLVGPALGVLSHLVRQLCGAGSIEAALEAALRGQESACAAIFRHAGVDGEDGGLDAIIHVLGQRHDPGTCAQ